MTAPLSLFPENMAIQAMSGDVKKAIEAAYESGWKDATRSLIRSANFTRMDADADEFVFELLLGHEALDELGLSIAERPPVEEVVDEQD